MKSFIYKVAHEENWVRGRAMMQKKKKEKKLAGADAKRRQATFKGLVYISPLKISHLIYLHRKLYKNNFSCKATKWSTK